MCGGLIVLCCAVHTESSNRFLSLKSDFDDKINKKKNGLPTIAYHNVGKESVFVFHPRLPLLKIMRRDLHILSLSR